MHRACRALCLGLALACLGGCAGHRAPSVERDPLQEHLARQDYGLPSAASERYQPPVSVHPEGSDEAARDQAWWAVFSSFLGW